MGNTIRAFSVFATVLAFGVSAVQLRANEPASEVLEVTVQRPDADPTLANVNGDKYALTLTIKNVSKQDALIWPFAEVQVFDRDGKPVPYHHYIGRFGDRDDGPLLESLTMEKLKPGQCYKIEIRLSGYQHEEKALTAWKLPKVGEYAVGIRYRYDRVRVKKDYAENMAPKKLDDEKMPWNRAVEIDKSISVPLVVK
jgi:hypothetical protein